MSDVLTDLNPKSSAVQESVIAYVDAVLASNPAQEHCGGFAPSLEEFSDSNVDRKLYGGEVAAAILFRSHNIDIGLAISPRVAVDRIETTSRHRREGYGAFQDFEWFKYEAGYSNLPENLRYHTSDKCPGASQILVVGHALLNGLEARSWVSWSIASDAVAALHYAQKHTQFGRAREYAA